LVTLDGSHFSEAILATVRTLALPLDAAVELFRVGQPTAAHDTPVRATYGEITPQASSTGTRLALPLPSAGMVSRVESREQALDRMTAELTDYLRDRARELAGITTTVVVALDDDPATAIIARARRTHPDLIAMATHGRTGLSHLLVGSVCEAVIRSGVAPVVVLRP
jgi:nucleotide-binding universal stress UspA family protein